jgi:predicted DsbA family dithiol-disulfide isomerase
LAELERNHDVAVEWLPYELRPDPIPLPDVSGPDGERFRSGWQHGVAPLAAEFGVEMHFPPFKPRSRRAHEAAEHAREHGRFADMRRAIFEAYFVANRDVDDLEVLLDLARSVRLDPELLRRALDEGRYTARVEELEELSRRLGVRAVPTVVIGGLAVEGVRPYPFLRRVLEEAERRPAPPSSTPPTASG